MAIIKKFWNTAPCSLIEVDRRFIGEYCFNHQVLFIALMMEAVGTSETFVYFETTRRYIPEGYHLRTHRRDNLKSYAILVISRRSAALFMKYLLLETDQSLM
jgi:hypothetical protein